MNSSKRLKREKQNIKKVQYCKKNLNKKEVKNKLKTMMNYLKEKKYQKLQFQRFYKVDLLKSKSWIKLSKILIKFKRCQLDSVKRMRVKMQRIKV